MTEKNIYKELIERIFVSRELYDSLREDIELCEKESLKPNDNLVYSIEYSISRDKFLMHQFTDTRSYIDSDDLIRIITIQNQYNDLFWSEDEINEEWTIEDAIEDAIDEIISETVDFDMDIVKENLENALRETKY